MIKTVIFDLDGTLLEWKDEYIFALKNVLKKLNLDFDDKKIIEIDTAIAYCERYLKIYTNSSFVNHINKKCNIKLPLEFADLLIEEQCNCYEKYSKEKLDVIKYLSSKYTLICLTNWFTKTQEERLSNAGIGKYFKIVSGGDKHELKPSLKAFSIVDNPKECVMIGDSLKYDILPAIKCGMQAILLTKNDVQVNQKYRVISKIEELKEIL